MHKLIATFLGIAALAAAPAVAAPTDYQVGFGPFVGGGSISNGAHVRNTSGYTVSLQRDWRLTDSGLTLGPRVEFSNAFINTKETESDTRQVATYDNRIFAAGLRLSHPVGHDRTFAQALYLTAVAGRGYSKLSVDSSTDRTYRQDLVGGIYGSYFASEFGAWIPLKGNFALNLAVASSLYRANQQDAKYTADGDGLDASGAKYNLSESGEAKDTGLDKVVTIKTLAATVGLALGF